MPRNLSSPMITAVTGNDVSPAFLLDLGLVSGDAYVWSGWGSIAANGNTYAGIGSFGAISDVTEGSDVKARGMRVGLSGIDPTLLGDTLGDIQIGAAVTFWLAAFTNGAVLATYPLFVGTVDKPAFNVGPDAFMVTVALETKLANLQRPTNRRYTNADQRVYYPDDIAFAWVETLNDIALIWG